MIQTLTLRQPDDWHLHLRDGDVLGAVVGETARHFARAIVMPNLVPPVVTGADARAYRERILQALEAGDDTTTGTQSGSAHAFEPLMTLYLTEQSDPTDVVAAAAEGLIKAVKLYPAGATTNSASGVTDIERVMPVLEAMADAGIVLCVHGEVTASKIDIFDREARFIDTVLAPLRARLPELRIVLEHITTAEGVAFVKGCDANQAGTLTPHHLMLDRNHLLAGGIRPHYYCLPVLKRNTHRESLVRAATSGDARFFLGTDSAPHHTGLKLAPCGCAGVFNAPVTLSCLAEVFEAAGKLEALEGFVSLHGPAFYDLPVNEMRIQLQKRAKPLAIPESIDAGGDTVTLFNPGSPLYWHVVP